MDGSGREQFNGVRATRVIGAAIRRCREQRGWTLEALAGAADISYQYLSGVETGKENFSLRILERLATALAVPLPALVVAAYEQESQAHRGH